MRLISLLLCLMVIVAPARAQDAAVTPESAQAPVAAQDSSDLPRRMELAIKMHEIRPMAVQIEEAINALSLRYPEDKRELFVSKMLQTFDQKAMTEISVKAMAETFTAAELEKMIDFYGSAEGKAVAEKMPVYQSLVEPEIVRKIDKALMEIRTGSAPE